MQLPQFETMEPLMFQQILSLYFKNLVVEFYFILKPVRLYLNEILKYLLKEKSVQIKILN